MRLMLASWVDVPAQFSWMSMGAKFYYVPAYFLTNGLSAVQLLNLFEEGVRMLASAGFIVTGAVADGAAENRTFQVGDPTLTT